MPGNDIGRGNINYDQVLSLTLTPVAVATITAVEQDFTVPGLAVGDHVDLQCNVAQTVGVGITNCRVKSANTLTVQFTNPTAGSVTPAAGNYLLNVNRPFLSTTNAVVNNMT